MTNLDGMRVAKPISALCDAVLVGLTSSLSRYALTCAQRLGWKRNMGACADRLTSSIESLRAHPQLHLKRCH